MNARTTMEGSWKHRATLAAALALGLGTASVAAAGPHGGGCGGGPGGDGLAHLERGVAHAGLPAETAKAIYQRLDEARVEQRAIQTMLAEEHEKMRALLDQESTNADAVMAQADVVGALETQMRRLELRTLVSIRSLVTPEQWSEVVPKRPGNLRNRTRES